GGDVHAGGVGVLVADCRRRQPRDPAPGRIARRGERAERDRPGRGIGRVVDVERGEAGRVLDVEGAVDALDAPGVAHVDRVRAAAAVDADGDALARVQDVDRVVPASRGQAE